MSGACRFTTVRLAFWMFLSAAISGCANLKVTMEVINPDLVQAEQDRTMVADGVPKIRGMTDDNIDISVAAIRADHRNAFGKVADLYRERATRLPEGAAKDLRKLAGQLTADFDRNVSSRYDALASDLKRYRADAMLALGSSYSVRHGDLNYAGVLAILRAWQQRIAQFNTMMGNSIDNMLRDQVPTAQALEFAAVAKAEIESATTKRFAQVSIQDSPFAYAVAGAEDGNRRNYNQVYARGDLGATDVAIKLDPATGNYLLKGLSFDPSDVAAVAAKVSTQALLIGAQIARVPVELASTTASGTTGAALATSSGALATAQATLETQRAKDQARRAALQSLASVILNEEADIKNADAATRKSAMETIKSAFDKRTPLLRPAANP